MARSVCVVCNFACAGDLAAKDHGSLTPLTRPAWLVGHEIRLPADAAEQHARAKALPKEQAKSIPIYWEHLRQIVEEDESWEGGLIVRRMFWLTSAHMPAAPRP